MADKARKIKNKLNYVSLTVVLKNGEIVRGKAMTFMYHDLEKRFVVDWLETTEPYEFEIGQVENFMVTR